MADMSAPIAAPEMYRTTTTGPAVRTLRVAGVAGELVADALRLPSGHPFIAVTVQPHGGEPDVLTRRATAPLEAAWDRGGDAALFVELERIYAEVLP